MLRNFQKLREGDEDDSWNFDEDLPTLAPEKQLTASSYEQRSSTFWQRKAESPSSRYKPASGGFFDDGEERDTGNPTPRDTQVPTGQENIRRAPPASSAASHVNRTFEVEMVLCLLGLGVATSLFAWAMDISILGLHKLQWYVGPGWSVLLSIVLVWCSVMVTFIGSPLAAGSGIPEMKAALAGFEKRIPSPLTLSPSGVCCGQRGWSCLPSCRPTFLSVRTLVSKVRKNMNVAVGYPAYL